MKTFRQFVVGQLARLESFAGFAGQVPEAGRAELRDWLESRAGIAPGEKEPSDLAWLQRDGARRVKQTVDELLTFDGLPGLPELRAVWIRLFSTASTGRVNADCEECAGSGFMLRFYVDRQISAALPCPRGCCAPPSTYEAQKYDHQAMFARYREEMLAAAERRAAYKPRGTGRAPRASEADIAKMREMQDAARRSQR